LIPHIFTSLFITVKFFLKEIRKKEEPKDCKNNKKLDYDYYPDLSSPAGHISETFVVKMEQPVH
jgi:hypothetical protein